ncbi:MAG: ArsC/Spx/MgsR family protein [Acidimicrobiia bacterium]
MAERYLVYYNPQCSNARGTVEILRDKGLEVDIHEYLEDPLDRAALERILDAIPNPPADLVRKDKRFEELSLAADDYKTHEAVIELLLEHPELMQRPVVFRGDRALITRPPEQVLRLLD